MIKKSYLSITFLFTTCLLISLSSCNPGRKYEKDEKDAITGFLAANSDFQKKPSGLYYMSVLEGTGLTPVEGDSVFCIYTGKFLNGQIFDSNTAAGAPILAFAVNDGTMIPGIEEGVTYMKQGGKAQLLLPSSLAYGTTGFYTIPGYTALLYEIELTRVKPGK